MDLSYCECKKQLKFFASFCIGKISHQQQHKGYISVFFRALNELLVQLNPAAPGNNNPLIGKVRDGPPTQPHPKYKPLNSPSRASESTPA